MSHSSHPAGLTRLRFASILEGISYLVLLGIAMPLKYVADLPAAVKYCGWVHGLLFLTLCGFLLNALLKKRLSFHWCVIVFICALLPFGPFVVDRKLKQLDA